MDVELLVAGAVFAAGVTAVGAPLISGLHARRRFEAHVNACYVRLGTAEKELAGIQVRAEAYPHDLPMPFVPFRHALDSALDTAHVAAAGLHTLRRALLHGAGQPPSRTDLRGIRRLAELFGEPHRWRRLAASSVNVDTALASLETAVKEASAALARLEDVPATIAATCAGLETTARQAMALADELAARGFGGATLDLSATVARDLAARLATARTTTPRDTVATFELAELLSVPVAEVYARVGGWARDARRLDQALADARSALADAHRRIGALPAGIDGAELARRLVALRDTLEAVEQGATRADVQALAGIVVRTHDVVDAAGVLADDADETTHRQIEFTAHYRRASVILARAEAEMQASAAEPIYPLDWREWAGRCASAQRTLALIGDPAAVRTPHALEVDGALAERVAGQAARLIEAVGHARMQREALRRLLHQPVLAPDRPWEARAAALHNATREYAPENWPAADRVAHLREDACNMAALHARWVPSEPWLPLPVDTLDQRLDAVAHLSEALTGFEPGLERIEETLVALHTAEAQAREVLADSYRNLTQLVGAVHGASPSFDRSVTRHLGVLRQMTHHCDGLEAAFARRDRGTVTGKVQRADRWARAAQRRLKPVCRALAVAAADARDTLASDLDALAYGLQVDAEPAVRDALTRLSAPDPTQPKMRGEKLARAAAAIAYARALANDRNATVAVSRALSTATRSLSEPLAAWQAARADADTAWQRLETCRRTLETEWPPLACDTGRPGRLRDDARRARDEARHQEERHLGSARRISEVTSRLKSLSTAYARAAAVATEAETAARQAHARVQAAAVALDAARSRSPQPEIENEIERVRRKWFRRPPGEEEAIRELEQLLRRLQAKS